MRNEFRKLVVLSLASLMPCLAVGQHQSTTDAVRQALPYRLSLQDAIQKAFQANLNVLVGSTRIEEAEGTQKRLWSAVMLPRVNAQTYASMQNRNLRAFGISTPSMPEVVGPFSNYDVRIFAQQNLIDLENRHSLKASEQAVDSRKMDLRDARDLIVRAITSLYLNAQSASARVTAAQSRVTDATTLYKLARDKHDAGTATGVDVLRAQVQLANDKQALLIADNQYKLALLALARNLGMSPSTPLTLSDPLQYRSLSPSEAESLVSSALMARADYLSLASQRQELVEKQRANHARNYPKLSINGNYGGIGRSIGGIQGTGSIQGQVDFTIFDNDRAGEAAELASRVKRIDDQIADLRRGIDQEIREALLNLDSAAQQVTVAEEGQSLAQRELELAQDRFQSGTANNVEVVTAQDELARAEENYILAVSSHVDAKCALARAQGDAEKNILLYLGNQ
jgi:outer membrane protein TolC